MVSRRAIGLACALMLAACGGGDSGSSGPGTGTTPTPSPTPIAISSAASASVAENSTGTVYQITTAGGSGTATYSLSGADAAAFAVSAAGAVTFRTAPDFEQPTDADRNNSYVVTVRAADTTGEATREVTIAVTNVADQTAVGQVGGSYVRASHIASVPGQARVFVTQRNGAIYLVDPTTTAQGTLYLAIDNIDDNTSGGARRGLMAVAAAPDFATSGALYAFVSTTTALEVRRYGRTAAGLGDAASADVILRLPFPGTTRDVGGWLGFGADNLLYVTTGSAGVAQTNASLLGKLLRVDPARDDFPADTTRDYAIPGTNPFAGGGGAGEVYAAGFVDPWRASIDGTNVYVGDQNNDMAPVISALYLVRPADAGQTFNRNGGQIAPVIQVPPRLNSAGTIVGGNVYRGPSPDFVGRYVFRASGGSSATSAHSGIFSIAANALVQGQPVTTPGCCTLLNAMEPVAFGEDAARNLYFTDGTALYMIQYR